MEGGGYYHISLYKNKLQKDKLKLKKKLFIKIK